MTPLAKVIHMEWGRRWSGGASQVLDLVAALEQLGWSGALLGSRGSPLLVKAMSKGIETYGFGLASELNLPAWAHVWKTVARLKSFAGKERKRVIGHIHSRRGLLGGILICRGLGIPAIVHWRVCAPLPPFIARRADAVIAISAPVLNVVRASGVPPERSFLIRSSIAPDYWVPRPEARPEVRSQLGIPPDTLVLVATARMAPGKGHDLILKALARVPPDKRPLLLIIGGSPGEPSLTRLVETLKLDSYVRFLPFQEDMRPYLWSGNIFVHCPDRFPEGLSVALLEAMACGLPVIATRVGGIPDLVRDGENGFLVQPGDEQNLASAIQTLGSDPEKRTAMGRKGRLLIENEYNHGVNIKKVTDVYKRLL